MTVQEIDEVLSYKRLWWGDERYDNYKLVVRHCIVYLRQHGFKLEKDDTTSYQIYLTGKTIQGFKVQFVGNGTLKRPYFTSSQERSILLTVKDFLLLTH